MVTKFIDNLDTIGEGVILSLLGKIFSNISGFLFNLILTRGLGPAGYGVYTFSITLIFTVKFLANIGADKGLLKFIPTASGDSNEQGDILLIGFLITTGGSIVVFISLILLSPDIIEHMLEEERNVLIIQLVSLLVPLMSLQAVMDSLFRGTENMRYYILINSILRPLSKLVATGTIILFGYALFGAVLATVLAWIVGLLGSLYIIKDCLNIAPVKGTSISDIKRKIDEFLTYSIPLVMADAGSLLYNRVDILMISFFLSASDVGIYGAAIVVAQFMGLPLSAVNQLFPSIASKLYNNNERDELRFVFQNSTRWIMTVSLLAASITIVYSKSILQMFGPEFTAGWLVFSLIVGAKTVNNLAGPSGFLLMMTNHQRLVSMNQWTFGLLNVVLNYIFITKLGIIGAGVATASVLAALNITRVIELWYLESIFPHSLKSLKPLLASLFTIPILIGISSLFTGYMGLAVGGITGFAIYMIILIQLGFEQQDIALIRRYIEKVQL